MLAGAGRQIPGAQQGSTGSRHGSPLFWQEGCALEGVLVAAGVRVGVAGVPETVGVAVDVPGVAVALLSPNCKSSEPHEASRTKTPMQTSETKPTSALLFLFNSTPLVGTSSSPVHWRAAAVRFSRSS
jgi:hypothetical protein